MDGNFTWIVDDGVVFRWVWHFCVVVHISVKSEIPRAFSGMIIYLTRA